MVKDGPFPMSGLQETLKVFYSADPAVPVDEFTFSHTGKNVNR